MDEILILICILLILFLLFPLFMLSKLSSLTKEIKELSKTIRDLQTKVIHQTPADPVQPKTQIVIKETPIVNPPIVTKPKPASKEEIETPPPVTKIHIVSPQTEKVTSPITPPKKKQSSPGLLERISGENLLSKIGIVTLVLGIAFFVKYAIDKDWINEVGRVGIGLLTGGILIGVAHKLRKQYLVFSSILTGGGIAVFYITITLAFREYELFSQTIAFILLILITVFSVLLSLLYNKKELAIFSLLGGFASPFMVSTGTGNYIVLFTYILILNSGMLVIAFLRNWKSVNILSYLLSLLLIWTWLISSFKDQYIGATTYLFLFFVQFYLLAIIDHVKSGRHIRAGQALLIISNNLSLFLGCLYIFNNYAADIRGIVTICIAFINAIIMIVLFRKSTVDRNLIYLLIAIVMTFVSLAIPIQLRGHAITMFWAAEMVILLWLWQKSDIRVFRTGFIILAGLVLISYIMDIEKGYDYVVHLPVLVNRYFITGVVVITGFILSKILLKKEKSENLEKEITKKSPFKTSTLIKAFTYITIALIYLVFYFEIRHQFGYESTYSNLILSTYMIVYISLVGFFYRKKNINSNLFFHALFFLVIFLAMAFHMHAVEARLSVFVFDSLPIWYFLVHWAAVPAMGYIIVLIAKNLRYQSFKKPHIYIWSLAILSIAFLTVEADHMAIILFQKNNDIQLYEQILYDVHTFVYPILWGIMAMILMIWGLKKKQLVLRKISLAFFAFIICKFYIYDVWRMSQTGRIISFVMLGLILLTVSFLQQKIKTLVSKNQEEEKSSSENMES